jgi:hypothetical protein
MGEEETWQLGNPRDRTHDKRHTHKRHTHEQWQQNTHMLKAHVKHTYAKHVNNPKDATGVRLSWNALPTR